MCYEECQRKCDSHNIIHNRRGTRRSARKKKKIFYFQKMNENEDRWMDGWDKYV